MISKNPLCNPFCHLRVMRKEDDVLARWVLSDIFQDVLNRLLVLVKELFVLEAVDSLVHLSVTFLVKVLAEQRRGESYLKFLVFLDVVRADELRCSFHSPLDVYKALTIYRQYPTFYNTYLFHNNTCSKYNWKNPSLSHVH